MSLPKGHWQSGAGKRNRKKFQSAASGFRTQNLHIPFVLKFNGNDRELRRWEIREIIRTTTKTVEISKKVREARRGRKDNSLTPPPHLYSILNCNVDFLQTTFSGMTIRCEKKFMCGSHLDLSFYIFKVCLLRRVGITSCKEGIFWYSFQSVQYILRFQQVAPLSPLFRRCKFTLPQPLLIRQLSQWSYHLGSTMLDLLKCVYILLQIWRPC